MAINWGLLNPNIAAETVATGMNAFQSALQRGQQQREQAQTSELRDLQLKTGTQALQDKSYADQAQRLMAQAFEAHQRGDEEAARAFGLQAKSIDLPTAMAIGAQYEQAARQKQEADDRQRKFQQDQALAAAPLMLQAIPELQAARQQNPNMTREETAAFMQSRLGEYFNPSQLDGMMDDAHIAAAQQQYKRIWETSDAYRKEQDARRADDRELRNQHHQQVMEGIASNREVRLAQALTNRGPVDVPEITPNTPTGEDFLKTLSPGDRAHVKALAEGREPFPTGRAATDPRWQRLLSLTHQYDPSYDQVNAPARTATRKEFFGGGRSNKNISALNNVMGHLSQLAASADELDNGPLTPLNAAKNAYKSRTSDPALRRFRVAQSAVADELENVFTGTGGTLHGRTHWLNQFDEDVSSSTLRSTIAETLGLLDSRLNALADRYNKGMGTTKDPVEFLTPKAKEQYLKLKQAVNSNSDTNAEDDMPPEVRDALRRHGAH